MSSSEAAASCPTVAGLLTAVAAVRGEDIDTLDTAVLGDGVVAVSGAIDQLKAERARWLARFASRHGHHAEGAASIVSWATTRCRMSPSVAAEMVTTARHLEQLPETARAVSEGEIGYQHASVIAHAARDVGDERVREVEPVLVEAAHKLDVRRFGELARRVRECVDPDGSLRDANRMHEQRRLYLSQTFEGMFRLDGYLDPEGGAIVATVLNSLGPPPLPGDHRPASQRRADALVDGFRRLLDAGELPVVAGQRPHLWVTVPIETLRSEPGSPGGELRWAGPVVGDLVRRLACDAVRTEVTVGPAGEPLSVGRPTKTVLAPVRKQLVARDRGCRFPGCDRPPEWTEGHHIVWREAGGSNELANLVLFCRFHHHCVHEGGWRVRRAPDGELEFEPP